MSAFADTNIALYAVASGLKQQRAREALIDAVISVQVLNEAMHVCRRKWRLNWIDTDDILDAITGLVEEVRPITWDIHRIGRAIAERYRLAIYDSILLASALEAGCEQFYSEDLQSGQVIDQRLVITNPFAP